MVLHWNSKQGDVVMECLIEMPEERVHRESETLDDCPLIQIS